MDVHTRAVIAHNGLGHEGRSLAVGMGHIPDRVLQNLHPVSAFHQAVELGTDFVLAHRAHFVMMHFALDALLLHCEHHGVPNILQRVRRRHWKIAAFYRGTVTHVAALVLLPGGPRRFLGFDLAETTGHVHIPGHRVENEEFGLGTEIRGVAQTARFQVGLGAFSDGARVAVVAFSIGGFDAIAGDVEHRLIRKRVHSRTVWIGHQQHVRGLDALPPRDRGTVEEMSALELVHGERLDRHGDVLLLAAGVGEAQVHELDLLVLDQFHDVIGRHCHCRISSGFGLLVS